MLVELPFSLDYTICNSSLVVEVTKLFSAIIHFYYNIDFSYTYVLCNQFGN